MLMKSLIILFISFEFIFSQDAQNLRVITGKSFQCDESSFLKNLEVSTSQDENSNFFNIKILKDCELSKKWEVRDSKGSQCLINDRVFEGENNIRRSLRFTNKKSNNSERITIKDIKVINDKKISETFLTKNSFSLLPGESIDIFIDYQCIDMDESKHINNSWFNLKILVILQEGGTIPIEIIKICSSSYNNKRFDYTHLLLIIIITLVTVFATSEYFNNDSEKYFLDNVEDMRDPENLTLVCLSLIVVLILFGVTGIFSKFSYIISILSATLCIGVVSRSILTKIKYFKSFEKNHYQISQNLSISVIFSACLIAGFILTEIWVLTENWVLSNLLAICISISILRIFRFNSFRWIAGIYICLITFDFVWINHKSNYFSESRKLASVSDLSLPFKIVLPEFKSTPFRSCIYLGIGDIIFPGIILLYSKLFDLHQQNNNYYYKIGIFALVAGNIIEVVIYYANNLPTPCFFYSGPLILIFTFNFLFQSNKVYEYFTGFNTKFELDKDNDNDSLKTGNNYEPPNEPVELKEVKEKDNEKLNSNITSDLKSSFSKVDRDFKFKKKVLFQNEEEEIVRKDNSIIQDQKQKN